MATTRENAKVFVVNWSGHDMSAAEKYGELVNLTEGDVPLYNPQAIMRIMREKLHAMGREDWILLSGHIAANILPTVMQAVQFGKLRLLIYEKKKDSYVPVECSIKDLLEFLQGGGTSNE